MTDILLEVRLALRRWRARPLFAAMVVITLALGIGSTTAIFSVLDAVLLRPLPWHAADRLVTVQVARPHWRTDPVLSSSWDRGSLSWPIFKSLQQGGPLEAVGTYSTPQLMLDADRSEMVSGMQVSASFLPMLGVTPVLGRFFDAGEDDAPSDAVLIGHEAWQRRFGGAADIVGRRVTLDSSTRTIVGVVPAATRFGAAPIPEFYVPWGNLPPTQRTEGNHFMQGVGRLRAGVTPERVEAEIAPIVTGSETPDRKTSRVRPLAEQQRGSLQRPLLILFGAAVALLLIGCANVAGLLLGEASARGHETAIRVALGATRRRLGRQLLVESLQLATAATAAGLLLARVMIPALIALAPAQLPGSEDAGIDTRLVLLSVALTLATTALFGILPYVLLGGVEPSRALRSGAWNSGARWSRPQRTAVTLQIGIAALVLVTATLFGETVLRVTAIPTGFDARGVVVATVRYPATPAVPLPERPARTQRILESLAALPGVTRVAAVSTAPFSGGSGSNSFEIEGYAGDQKPTAFRQVVTEDYFETVRIPLLKGRGFTSADAPGAFAAIVSAEFERRYMNGEAVGKRFSLNGNVHEIVGVAGNTKHRDYTEEDGAMFYLLHRQLPNWGVGTFLVRAATSPDAMVATIRTTIASHDARAAVFSVTTMDDLMARTVAEERYRAVLTILFAIAAVVLSGIGIYGLVARSVAVRVREFGVRAALGATPRETLRMVLKEGLWLAAGGLALGLGGAALAARGLESLLYGVRSTSPHIFVVAAIVLGGVTLLGAIVPAWRASRVDPLVALREG